MKRPNNFDKIHGITFGTKSGTTYRFSVDTEDNSVLWVFPKPDNTKYALAFCIDWKNESYEIKRAESGNGKNWEDILHRGNYSSEPMKTMDSFVDWIHYRVNEFEWCYNRL